MKKLTVGYIFTLLFLTILIVGIGIIVYLNIFSAPVQSGVEGTVFSNPFLYFSVLGVGELLMIWIVSKNFFRYRKYYQSIEKMGLIPDRSKISTISNLGMLTKEKTINFDTYFQGGLTGEVTMEIKNKKVKLMHHYQPDASITMFFSQVLPQQKIVAIFETDIVNKNVCFIFQKGLIESANSIKSKKGILYILADLPRRPFSGNAEEVFSIFSDNYLDTFEKLPGKNIIVGQNGKIRLIHDGIMTTPENIKLFAESLVNMIKN